MSKSKKIVLSGLLIAVAIILERGPLSYKTPTTKVTLFYVPVMVSAMLLGPMYSSLIAGLSDLIGALLFPTGPYAVGFTISAALSGLIYGLFLYSKNNTYFKPFKMLVRLILSNILVLGIVELPLDSLWLHIYYSKVFTAMLVDRIPISIIMLPIQVIIMYFLSSYIGNLSEKYLIEKD